MWFEKSTAANMMDVYSTTPVFKGLMNPECRRSYLEELDEIEAVTPKFVYQMSQCDMKNNLLCRQLMIRYSKRNAQFGFVKELVPVATFLIKMSTGIDIKLDKGDSLMKNLSKFKIWYKQMDIEHNSARKSAQINKEEVLFWLFTTLVEDKLPLGYYDPQRIESSVVMMKTFDFLFQLIDEDAYIQMSYNGQVSMPAIFFQQHF